MGQQADTTLITVLTNSAVSRYTPALVEINENGEIIRSQTFEDLPEEYFLGARYIHVLPDGGFYVLSSYKLSFFDFGWNLKWDVNPTVSMVPYFDDESDHICLFDSNYGSGNTSYTEYSADGNLVISTALSGIKSKCVSRTENGYLLMNYTTSSANGTQITFYKLDAGLNLLETKQFLAPDIQFMNTYNFQCPRTQNNDYIRVIRDLDHNTLSLLRISWDMNLIDETIITKDYIGGIDIVLSDVESNGIMTVTCTGISSANYRDRGIHVMQISSDNEIIWQSNIACSLGSITARSGVFADPIQYVIGNSYVTQDGIIYTFRRINLFPVNTYKVSFDSNQGSVVLPVPIEDGSTITEPANPTRLYYNFTGWYKEPECIHPWDFKNDCVSEDTTLYAGWAITAPTTPTSVKSYPVEYNSIRLTWNGFAAATGYEVWRATSASGPYSLTGTTATIRFTNTGLNTGSTYYYKIKAYRTEGSTTQYSSFSTVVTAIPVPAASATFTAAQASYNSIKVEWSAVSGATGYELYRSNSSSGVYSLLSKGSTLSYINTNVNTGTTYYYKVRAYRLVGTANIYGACTKIISFKTTLLTPYNVKATSLTFNSIKVTWGAIAGSTKYEVYRSTSSTGSYVLLYATVYNNYTDANIYTGVRYYYKVRAYRLVSGSKVYSSYSNIVSVTAILGAPSSIKITMLSPACARVSWAAAAGASGYEIWRAYAPTDTYTLMGSTNSSYYVNSGLIAGKSYYYKVRSYRIVGATKVYSIFSAVVSVRP